jgi:hypothetical protein
MIQFSTAHCHSRDPTQHLLKTEPSLIPQKGKRNNFLFSETTMLSPQHERWISNISSQRKEVVFLENAVFNHHRRMYSVDLKLRIHFTRARKPRDTDSAQHFLKAGTTLHKKGRETISYFRKPVCFSPNTKDKFPTWFSAGAKKWSS